MVPNVWLVLQLPLMQMPALLVLLLPGVGMP
jgi:hypothetical protein